MESNLAGRVVLVTGASGGIGSAIARAFAREGTRVVLHYRSDRASIERLQRELGNGCLAVREDLTKEAEVRRLFATATKRFGRVDTLIANAGSWETTGSTC